MHKNLIAALFIISFLSSFLTAQNLNSKDDTIKFETHIDIPAGIPCEACTKTVSKLAKSCIQCGHPTANSIDAYTRKRLAESALKVKQQLDFHLRAKVIGKIMKLENIEPVQKSIVAFQSNPNVIAPTSYTGWVKFVWKRNDWGGWTKGDVWKIAQVRNGKQHGLDFDFRLDNTIESISFFNQNFCYKKLELNKDGSTEKELVFEKIRLPDLDFE